MNTQGMMFGGEGPVMVGTWYNPNTGDAFTVRDSFFEDNQYVVTTTDGRYLKYNQIQNYVQTDMKLEDLKRRKVDNQRKEDVLPAEVASILEGEVVDPYAEYLLPDEDILTRGLGNLADNKVETRQRTVQQPLQGTMNEAIIEKALKNAPKPEIKVDVNWDVYPEKQIEMLKDVMEISEDEIISWYLDNIDMMELVDALKSAIKSRILYKEKSIIIPIVDNVDNNVDMCCDPGFYVDIPNIATKIETNTTDCKVKPKKTTRKKKNE